MATESSVKVCFRFSPNFKGGPEAVTFQDEYQVSVLSKEMKARGERRRQYRFDRVWQGDADQADVYNTIGKPLLKNIFEGYNSTLFVYGQTGSGKTYSMFGPDGGKMGNAQEGMVPRILREMFAKIEADRSANPELTYTVTLSIVDVYLECVRDLLNPAVMKKGSAAQSLQVRYHQKCGVNIHYKGERQRGAREEEVRTVEDVLKVIERARDMQLKTGAVAKTKMNAVSSRSHLVVQCMIKETGADGEKKTKLLLCDLAGSEKVRNTGAQGTQLKQAQNINYGLSVLGAVLHSLTDSKEARRRASGQGGTIPFRESKLTQILQDSLGGNAKTALICTARPNALFAQETLSTLRFGNNAKKIKNKAIKQIARTAAQWEKLHNEDRKRMQRMEREIVMHQRVKRIHERRSSIFQEAAADAGVDIAALTKQHEELRVDTSELERTMSDELNLPGGLSKLSSIGETAPMLVGSDGGTPQRDFFAAGGLTSCSCGLARELANERLTIEDMKDELQDRQNRMRAQDGHISQLQDMVCTLEEAEEQRTATQKESNDLKGDIFRNRKVIEALTAENSHLKQKLEYAHHESRTVSSSALTRTMEAFRDDMKHLGQVALDESAKVLRIVHSGTAEAKTQLVERISNQSAELERLRKIVAEADSRIGAFRKMKEHHQDRQKQAELFMLTLAGKFREERSNAKVQRDHLNSKINRRDAYIDELKAGEVRVSVIQQQGLQVFLDSLPSNRRSLPRKKRRRNRAGETRAGSAGKRMSGGRTAASPLNGLSAISTKTVGQNSARMMSPSA